jgi:hypothetical protein
VLIQSLILFLLVSFHLKASAQDTGKDDLLRFLVGKYGQAELSIQYPGAGEMDIITRNVSVFSVRDMSVMISVSKSTVDWFISRHYDYKIMERIETKGIVSAVSVKQAMDWQSYPSYSQYLTIMQSFATTYPALCHVDTIGKSINGKYVLAVKISDNVNISEDEPKVFYSSSIHGDEIGGYVLMLHLIDFLLSNYNTSSRVRNMVDNLEIWINPLANPDGTYNNGNTISYPTRYNANGYDLNRNFPDPLDLTIVPQKEVIDMMSFMKKHKFCISANFHGGDEVVNYPWDRWYSILHADDFWFNSISRAYADTVHVYSPAGYLTDLTNGVTRGAVWYVIYGGRQDYTTYELHGRELTIELDYSKETPAADLEPLWQYNYRSLLGYLENALYGIHGITKDGSTGASVPAKVFISGHDTDRSEAYSDTTTGRFIRLLAPGSWNLTFSATGYHDVTISNVQVVAGQRTDLVVNMNSISTSIDPPGPQKAVLFPDPAKDHLYARLPGIFFGKINIKIYNLAGSLLRDYDSDLRSGNQVEIEINNLKNGAYLIVFRNTVSGSSFRSRFIISGKGI